MQAEHIRDGTLTEEQIYRKFDLFDDMAPERYCNDTGTEHLLYVLPFYELYKAMYVAKMYTYWYWRYVHEATPESRISEQLSWSLNQRHEEFHNNFSSY